MGNLFNSVRVRPPKLNRFNLSHDVKLTGKFGRCIPILCVPTLPGDIFKMNTEILVRLAPMVAPIMTKVNVYTHFFFVPNRLLWSNWKEFITGGEDGTSNPQYPHILITSSANNPNFASGCLADYLNFPTPINNTGIWPGKTVSLDALPFRAYHLIWNEYYRDQNLMDEIDIMKDVDGNITALASGTELEQKAEKLLGLAKRSWQKDYFTSALPFAQRGDEVELPLTGDAAISNTGGLMQIVNTTAGGVRYAREVGSGSFQDGDVYIAGGDVTVGSSTHELGNNTFGDENQYTNIIGTVKMADIAKALKVDLSKVSSSTINELRRAIKAQEFLEVAARGGSRYIEQIYSYFGVRSSDARLQRPEFLGGGKSPIMISDVLQTSQTTETSAQATPSGHGISVQNSHKFKYRCEEHGYLIGIMTIMPKAAYMQGMPRIYRKSDRLDYYWPQFAHLGEQEIKNEEIYYDYWSENPSVLPSGTFGYTPRYAEYKTIQDSIHGDFRDSLSFWHMARNFGNAPQLNEDFLTNVEDAANRVFNVVDEDVDKIWCNIHHNLVALRKMPKYGTPLL